jgi:hypothetical protein
MITDKQIEEWKAKYGGVLEIGTEDGDEVYLKDPVHDLVTMKQAYAALQKSPTEFVAAIVSNSWLHGPEELKTDEGFLFGLEDELQDLVDIPDWHVKKGANGVSTLVFEDYKVTCRKITRDDISRAAKRNRLGEPFESGLFLAKRVATEGMTETLQADTRAMLGLAAAMEDLKGKKSASVKKR